MTVFSNFQGTLKDFFSFGRGSNKVSLLPDRTAKNVKLQDVSGNDFVFFSPTETGLISGGSLALGSAANQVDVSAGVGRIISTSDPSNPTIQQVSWPDTTLTLTLSSGKVEFFWIYVSSSVTVSIRITPPDVAFLRSNIFLGYVQAENASLIAASPYPKPSYQTAKNIDDIFLNLNQQAKAKGFKPHKVDNALSFWVDKGCLYVPGRNWHTDPDISDCRYIGPWGDATTPCEFDAILQDGALLAINQTVVPKIYESGGSSHNLTGDEAVIHYLFLTQQGFYLQIGQTNYTSIREAFEYLDYDRHNFNYASVADIPNQSVLVAQMVISNQAVDFEDPTLATSVAVLDGENGATISPVDQTLVPQYKLRAVVDGNVSQGDELSMNVSGHLQKYPETGGESNSQYTTDQVTLHDLAFLHDNIGVVAWVTPSNPAIVYHKVGYSNSGVISWTPASSRSFSSNINSLRCKPIPGTDRYVIIVTLDNGYMTAWCCRNEGSSTAPTQGSSYNLATSGATDADGVWDSGEGYFIYAWAASGDIINRYSEINTSDLSQSFPYGNVAQLSGGGTKVQCTTQGSDIITLSQNGSTAYIAEKAWNKPFYGTGRYDDSAGSQTISSSVSVLCGVEQHSGNILSQIKNTSGDLQTFSAPFSSGSSISSPSQYGIDIPGESGWIMKTSSGIGYNLVYRNDDKIDLYEGQPSGSWIKIYTAVQHFESDPCDTIVATLFGSVFTYMVLPDYDVADYVYFIDSNATRTDHFIAVAAENGVSGQLIDADIALPLITLPRQYTPGLTYYYGPYKYQVVTHNQAVLIIEATTMMS